IYDIRSVNHPSAGCCCTCRVPGEVYRRRTSQIRGANAFKRGWLIKMTAVKIKSVVDSGKMKLIIAGFAIILGLVAGPDVAAVAADVEFPQIIKLHYEAIDEKTGGSFVIFSER